jgi:hypothetical protein
MQRWPQTRPDYIPKAQASLALAFFCPKQIRPGSIEMIRTQIIDFRTFDYSGVRDAAIGPGRAVKA